MGPASTKSQVQQIIQVMQIDYIKRCILWGVNKQDFLQVFQGSGIGKILSYNFNVHRILLSYLIPAAAKVGTLV